MTTPAPCVVTAVHGTWASRAGWTSPGSALHSAIRARFGEGAVIEPFLWSGKNSHGARLQAGQDLVPHLLDISRRYPGVPSHIVAHSHGGNVALYAVRDPRLAGKVQRVVCLATPFISAEVRALDPMLGLAQKVMLLGALGLPIAMAVFFAVSGLMSALGPASALPQIESKRSTPLEVLVGATGAAALWAWLGIAMHRFGRRFLDGPLRGWLTSRQRQFVDLYSHPAERNLPVLNIQVEGDEARGWLGRLQRCAEKGFDCATPRAILLTAVIVWSILAFSLLGSIPWLNLLSLSAEKSFFYVIGGLVVAYVVFLFLLCIAFLVAHVFLITAPIALRAHGLGFGEWSLFDNWLVRIQAAEAPPGEAQTILYKLEGRGMRHSRVHDDRRAMSEIADWMMGTPDRPA